MLRYLSLSGTLDKIAGGKVVIVGLGQKLGLICPSQLGILNEVKRVLLHQIQRHDMRLAALQVHIPIPDSRLMPAPPRILHHKLQLWQCLRRLLQLRLAGVLVAVARPRSV